MTRHIDQYLIPTSIPEVLQALAQYGDKAAIIAGGSVRPLRLPSRVSVLVDLMRCGLEGISLDGDTLSIGATTTASVSSVSPTAAL